MLSKAFQFFLFSCICVGFVVCTTPAKADPFRKFKIPQADTTIKKDSLRYPIADRRGDPFSSTSRNPFDLLDTSFLKKEVEYDPITKEYYIKEKIGSTIYRKPMAMSYEEFMRLRGQQMELENFRRRSKTSSFWFKIQSVKKLFICFEKNSTEYQYGIT